MMTFTMVLGSNVTESAYMNDVDAKDVNSVNDDVDANSVSDVNGQLKSTVDSASSYENGLQHRQANNNMSLDAVDTCSPQNRRTSGRIRTAPQFYKSDPIPVKKDYKKLKKRQEQLRAKRIAEGKIVKPLPNKSDSKKNSSKKKSKDGKKEPFIISLKLARKSEPPPVFVKIETSQSTEMLWEKLALRDFLIRFDKYVKLPTRHGGTINDPSIEWNEYICKAIIVGLLKIVLNDGTERVEHGRHYLAEIEKTPAESSKLWIFLAEFLAHSELIERERALKGNDATLWTVDTSSISPNYPDSDVAKVRLVTRLMFLAAASETLRIAIQDDSDSVRQLQQESSEKLKELKATWDAQSTKLNELMGKQTDRQRQQSKDKLEASKHYFQTHTRQIEQHVYQQRRKCSVRTSALGTDVFQNRYWHFQQKSVEWPAWGSWIICEVGPGMNHPVAEIPKRLRKKKENDEKDVKGVKGLEKDIDMKNVEKNVEKSVEKDVEKDMKGVNCKGELENGIAKLKSSQINLAKKELVTAGEPEPIKKELDGPVESNAQKTKKGTAQVAERPLVPPHPNLESALYYVAGKENIQQLAKWINSQYPVSEKPPVWVKYLETYASYIDE